jgi:hypothetical protein
MGPKDLVGFCEAFCQLVVGLVIFSSISIPVYRSKVSRWSRVMPTQAFQNFQSEMDRNGGQQQQQATRTVRLALIVHPLSLPWYTRHCKLER